MTPYSEIENCSSAFNAAPGTSNSLIYHEGHKIHQHMNLIQVEIKIDSQWPVQTVIIIH